MRLIKRLVATVLLIALFIGLIMAVASIGAILFAAFTLLLVVLALANLSDTTANIDRAFSALDNR